MAIIEANHRGIMGRPTVGDQVSHRELARQSDHKPLEHCKSPQANCMSMVWLSLTSYIVTQDATEKPLKQ